MPSEVALLLLSFPRLPILSPYKEYQQYIEMRLADTRRHSASTNAEPLAIYYTPPPRRMP